MLLGKKINVATTVNRLKSLSQSCPFWRLYSYVVRVPEKPRSHWLPELAQREPTSYLTTRHVLLADGRG